ncbi:MAG: helix-turn-helix transcriptional regulator [Legionella sp.]|nr:helix-turn-helix transcriptional regulator [Legionella sp.]
MRFSLNDVELSPFWKFQANVNEMCSPIFQQFGISYFDYTRFYPDNTCISFSSDPHYVRYLVNNNNYSCAAGFLLPGKHLWHQYIDTGFIESTQDDFDYFHGITYIRHRRDYIEEINFGAAKASTTILSLYFEKSEILEYFTTHFVYLLSQFLEKNHNSKIILPDDFMNKNFQQTGGEEFLQFVESLHKQSNIRKNTYLIQVNGKPLTLTEREINCLAYLKNGLSAKLIAREMKISPRTVEIFLNNILQKTGSISRIQLLSSLDNEDTALIDKLVALRKNRS